MLVLSKPLIQLLVEILLQLLYIVRPLWFFGNWSNRILDHGKLWLTSDSQTVLILLFNRFVGVDLAWLL